MILALHQSLIIGHVISILLLLERWIVHVLINRSTLRLLRRFHISVSIRIKLLLESTECANATAHFNALVADPRLERAAANWHRLNPRTGIIDRQRLRHRLRPHLRGHGPWIEPSAKRISKRRLRKSTTKRLLEATELWLLEATTESTEPTKLWLLEPTEPTELRLLESAEL